MNKAILSYKYPQFAQALRALGYNTVPSEETPCKMPYERDHADLQCLIMNDTAFVLSCCKQLTEALYDDYNVVLCGEDFTGEYPKNTVLSAVLLRNKLICRYSSLDSKVKEYCINNGYEIINVNQGYAKCSCAVAGDNAIITADKGIISALQSSDINILAIGEGNIRLSENSNGFIGGASGYDPESKTLFFCGDISKHPDHKRIIDFCDKLGTRVISLTNGELTDIGGIIFC